MDKRKKEKIKRKFMLRYNEVLLNIRSKNYIPILEASCYAVATALTAALLRDYVNGIYKKR